ncbi:hypothetical protein A2U01_0073942, partial [Trifolium medium]|nr:hypothetical protein [Trifolium medium]
MHRQYREQQAQAERHHREMMQILQQRVEPPPEQEVQPQIPRGNPVFRELCRMNPPTFEGQYEPTE